MIFPEQPFSGAYKASNIFTGSRNEKVESHRLKSVSVLTWKSVVVANDVVVCWISCKSLQIPTRCLCRSDPVAARGLRGVQQPDHWTSLLRKHRVPERPLLRRSQEHTVRLQRQRHHHHTGTELIKTRVATRVLGLNRDKVSTTTRRRLSMTLSYLSTKSCFV